MGNITSSPNNSEITPKDNLEIMKGAMLTPYVGAQTITEIKNHKPSEENKPDKNNNKPIKKIFGF